MLSLKWQIKDATRSLITLIILSLFDVGADDTWACLVECITPIYQAFHTPLHHHPYTAFVLASLRTKIPLKYYLLSSPPPPPFQSPTSGTRQRPEQLKLRFIFLFQPQRCSVFEVHCTKYRELYDLRSLCKKYFVIHHSLGVYFTVRKNRWGISSGYCCRLDTQN